MRTTIDIDDDLMREAMRASGATTRRAAVEQGLRLLIDVRGQRTIRRLRGKVKWTGDLPSSLIATFCVEHDHALLHNDRDFDAFETLLHLQVVRP